MSLFFTSIPAKRLAESITGSATTFKLTDIEGWDGTDLVAGDFGTQAFGVFRDANGTLLELFSFDPATIASANIDFVDRGLEFSGDLTTEVAANKLTWPRGTIVELGANPPQFFQWLKEYIDAAAIAGGVPATNSVGGLVRLATQAEIDADTASSGGFGLATTPDQLALSKYFLRLPTAAEKSLLSVLYAGLPGTVNAYAGSTVPTGWLICDGAAVSRTTYSGLFTAIGTTWGVGNGSTTFNVPNLSSRSVVGAGTGTKVFTFASRSSDTVTATGMSNANNNEVQTGQAVLYSAPSGAMTGLTTNTTYYLIRIAYNQFKLATTLANAIAGTAITLSSDGTGTQTFTETLSVRALGETGGEETHGLTIAEIPSHTHTTNDNDAASGIASEGNTDMGPGTTGATGGSTAHNIMSPFAVMKYIIKT